MSVIPQAYNQGTGVISVQCSGSGGGGTPDEYVTYNSLTNFLQNVVNGVTTAITALSTNTFVSTDAEVTNDLDVGNDLTVDGRADLNGPITFVTLNDAQDSGPVYTVLLWDNLNPSPTGARTVRVDFANLSYDVTDNTLIADNLRAQTDVTCANVLADEVETESIGQAGAGNKFALPITINPSDDDVLTVIDSTTDPLTTGWQPIPAQGTFKCGTAIVSMPSGAPSAGQVITATGNGAGTEASPYTTTWS